MAYLSCDHGLLFQTPVSTKALNVSFENLSFVGTTVYLNGKCAVSIVNSTFSNCLSALLIDGTSTRLSLRKSVFTNNTNCLVLQTPEEKTADVVVDIHDVLFKKNPVKGWLLLVNNPRGLTSVQVSNSRFEENHSQENTTAFLIIILADERNKGHVRVENSSFISNHGLNGLLVFGCLNMYFHNLNFNTIDGALILRPYLHNNSGEILITDSIFSDCNSSLSLTLTEVLNANITVQITNTIFRSSAASKWANAAIGDGATRSSPELFSSYHISLDKRYFPFTEKKTGLQLSFSNRRHIKIDVKNSLFLKNEAKDYLAVLIILPQDVIHQCMERTTKFKNHVFFTNTRFEGNTGMSSIVNVRNGQTSFVNCVFTDNYILRSTVGGVLYLEEGTGSLHVAKYNVLTAKKTS